MGEFDPEAAEQLGNGVDEAIDESFPASDPPAEDHDDERGKPRPAVERRRPPRPRRSDDAIEVTLEDGSSFELDHGRVVIAAITSCTNTSNPSVMVGAGLLARNAVERGLARKPWVKTSLAPGSTVVTDYLEQAGLDRVPRRAPVQPGRLRLHHLHRQLRAAGRGDLGGDRREGPRRLRRALRQPQLRGPDQPGRQGQLPGQPAAGRRLRAGRADGHRPHQRAARRGLRRRAGLPARHLARARPRSRRWSATRSRSEMFTRNYADVFAGDETWNAVEVPEGDRYTWPDSTYVRQPSFFEEMPADPPGVEPIAGARVLAAARRLDHHRPHLAGRRDQEGKPGGQLADRAGGRARRLQLLRLAPRQPRGDDPRHLRQHPPAQPAGREGGRLHPPLPRRRGDVDLRGGDDLRRGGRAAGRPRRQGVRLRLLARLGGEGDEAARRPRRDRRELRAHPPLQPDRDGRAAAPVRRRRERRVTRPRPARRRSTSATSKTARPRP